MALAQYKYMDIIHRCFRCGYCKFPQDWADVDNCPAYARHRLESYSNGGRLWLIRAWVTGEIQWSPHLADIVYSCVACKNCEEKCPLSFSDKIITLSPHSFNAIKNKYPQQGADVAVYHYTQILADLIRQGRLRAPRLDGACITFHDPCFLGRWNNEYKAPRKVLKAVAGARFVEMERSGKSALCCGGGAGNYYTDLLGASPDSPARIRVRQARETGADILAVACPNCLTMLEDAVKVEGLESEIAVRDISELFGTSAR